MKKIFILLFAILLFNESYGQKDFVSNFNDFFINNNFVDTFFTNYQNNCPQGGQWKLVFHDEFNDGVLDLDKWDTFYPDTNGVDGDYFSRTHDTTLSQTIYKDDNIVLAGGSANIYQKRETATWKGVTMPFTSGVLHSKQKFRTYSKYEIRCRIPKGKGIWPAFWMFGWSTELDVFEFNCDIPNRVTHTVHRWDSTGSEHIDYNHFGPDYSAGMHTYAIEFDPDNIKFFVDGALTYSFSKLYDVSSTPAGCNTPPGLYYTPIVWPNFQNGYTDPLSVIIGAGIFRDSNGSGGNPFSLEEPTANQAFPTNFEIDYVRVYQRQPQLWLHDLNEPVFVTGDDGICQGIGSMRTYNVHNPSGDDNIVWTTSPNLSIINQSPTTITVAPIGNAGDAWIRATRNGNGALLHSTHKKDIWIGKPVANTVFGAGTTVGCTPLPLSASISSPDILQYQWNVSGGSIVGNANSADVTVDPINGPYGFTVSVRARNSCGWSNWVSKTYNTNCDGGPNAVRIVNDNGVISVASNEDRVKAVYLVSVIDGQSYILDTKEVTDIDVSYMRSGIYYILVITENDAIRSKEFFLK